MSMRIAQLVSARVMNGAARHCMGLSAALADRGHRILLMHRPEMAPDIAHPNIERLQTAFGRGPGELRRAAEALEAFGADVLHTHVSSAHTYGALFRVMLGAP